MIDQTKLGDLFSKFYLDLFTSSLPHRIEECLQAVPKRVSEEMNQSIFAPYTDQEVIDALFQINALGPDGFLAHFFSKILNKNSFGCLLLYA